MNMHNKFTDEKNKNIHECIQDIIDKEKKGIPEILRKAYVLSSYFLMKTIEIREDDIIVGQVRK